MQASRQGLTQLGWWLSEGIRVLHHHRLARECLSDPQVSDTAQHGFSSPCVALFRNQVCIIQPGNYARSTKIQPPLSAEEIWSELSEEEKAVYSKEYVQERADFFNSILSEGSTNGNEVVDAMVDALTSPAPKARYMVAKLKEKALVLVCALFPTAVMDSVLSYALSKVKLA
ncbi:short-chain dehydrogenase/reductase family 9C member 7-like isoform X1 [Geospiza fortis]|uniref:Short-chain dehydrogenase/reductase family 9C member 7-like isoform X1 n=1 Tax=Geospiza fortis TaxID=48883 RepID=A0A8N5ELB0_GEOFO|nr:short-chain dehydrogenase/reductase family 9C member 7-like isoform X1 [Geospiza fortis]